MTYPNVHTYDGRPCPECDETVTVETGPPEEGVIELLCARCGNIWEVQT